MPGLTPAEKSHWRDRFAARIAEAAERIEARRPALLERVASESRVKALASLGLIDVYVKLEVIRADEEHLARRKDAAQRLMLATLRGRPVDEVTGLLGPRRGDDPVIPREAAGAIARRQAAHREQLLADDPVGREVARLEAEEGRLLDIVRLADTPSQIRRVWMKLGELLGDGPTALEREALAIEPAEEA